MTQVPTPSPPPGHPNPIPVAEDAASALAPQSPGGLVLDQSLSMLAPLVQLLVAQGVGYPAFAQALKPLFMQAARRELQTEGAPLTDAAISVRSGVHRKEVRSATARAKTANLARSDGTNDPSGSASQAGLASERKALSLAEQVFTRWTTDAAYRDIEGRPATLPLTGPAPSFDALVLSITRDLSRRTVLDELIRLGLVRLEEPSVIPLAQAMVPQQGFADVMRYLSEHLHDHLAAGAANVQAVGRGETPPFLEHSLYANGLSADSIAQIAGLARTLWKPTFNQLADAARQRFEIDRAQALAGRIRIGIYVYSEPPAPSAASSAAPSSGSPAAATAASADRPQASPKTTRRGPRNRSNG